MDLKGVQKSRKPRFDLTFRFLDLNNIPYIAGNICIKWHISGVSNHDDRTTRAMIKEHKAVFVYERTTSIRFAVDKNNWLQECMLALEIIHEVKINGKDERSLLGVVKINLAEYVESSRVSEEPIVRRYLLHESKINSTIKLAIKLVQTDGERNFMAPSLRSAPQFVGIAGVMAAEHIAEDDAGPTTITVDPRAREAGDDLREHYKRTLAAELTCAPGEPHADKVIEDIFAGGDGWASVHNKDSSDTNSSRRGGMTDDTGAWSDGEQQLNQHQQHHDRHQKQQQDSRGLRSNKSSWSDLQFARRSQGQRPSRESLLKNDDGQYRDLQAKRSFGQASRRTDLTDRDFVIQVPDTDELDVREDLRCWITRPVH